MNKVILDMIMRRGTGHRVGATVIVVRERRERFVRMRISVVLMMVVVVRVMV